MYSIDILLTLVSNNQKNLEDFLTPIINLTSEEANGFYVSKLDIGKVKRPQFAKVENYRKGYFQVNRVNIDFDGIIIFEVTSKTQIPATKTILIKRSDLEELLRKYFNFESIKYLNSLIEFTYNEKQYLLYYDELPHEVFANTPPIF